MHFKKTYLISGIGLVFIFVTALFVKTGLYWIVGVGLLLFLLLIRTFQGEITIKKELVFTMLALLISLSTMIFMILNNDT